MRIGTRMATGFDQHFATSGITQAQFRILLAIWEEGGEEGIAPSVLADYLLIERGTVSVLTDRLVRAGWLLRKPGASRRTYKLVLTDAGQNVTIPRAIDLANHTLSGISPAELRRLRNSLELIETRLRSYTPPED
jgi:DNA-binding MarR family transcriptional regulator